MHGQSNCVPLVFPRALRSAGNLCATRLCSFSRHMREETHVDDRFVCSEFAPELFSRGGTNTERFAKLCEAETERGRPLPVPR